MTELVIVERNTMSATGRLAYDGRDEGSAFCTCLGWPSRWKLDWPFAAVLVRAAQLGVWLLNEKRRMEGGCGGSRNVEDKVLCIQ